ncbi:YdcF family protein [Cohnella silvisoli]|uniref:YdcF family protein n=1 Tax=Cohnella silvisoli TaxID=2873699 RepID=A0ABV1KNM5_9BACL|nr:YdcF family protein [Cohnella silvisoli]MCD9021015.1 YdcF family protein [Cohnella silvisoli]
MSGITKGRIPSSPPTYVRTRRSKWLRVFTWLAGIGLLAVLVWCASLYYLITHFNGVPKSGNLKNSDVGIVLGATLWDNKPSPGLRERLDRGLELYRAGAFSHFIVTGGLDNNGATLTEAEGMRNYLLELGVPDEAVVMDRLSRSTYENLSFAKDIMDRNGWKTAVIITHNYHGSRSADIARRLGYSPVQVSVTDSKVLKMSYHETREVLAYTKWLVTKLFL